MSAIYGCHRDDPSEQRSRINELEAELTAAGVRIRELTEKLAAAESLLGDARAEIKLFEGWIDAHYAAAFGHSACFERDEALWAHLTDRDGKERKWNRRSLPGRQEFRAGCRAYEESLFGPEK